MRQFSAPIGSPFHARERAARRLGPVFAAVLVLAALAGCDAPSEARVEMTEAAAARPTPELSETARFERVADASVTSADTLGADRDGLAARAAALRSSAAGLSGPVLDPDTRARLLAAGAAQP